MGSFNSKYREKVSKFKMVALHVLSSRCHLEFMSTCLIMTNPRERLVNIARHINPDYSGSTQNYDSNPDHKDEIMCEDGCKLKFQSCAGEKVSKLSVEQQAPSIPKHR